jgi:hypothetical protein
MNHDRSVMAADDADGRSWTIFRRTMASALVAFALLQPAIGRLGHTLDGRAWFGVTGAVVLAGLVCWRVSSRELDSHQPPWLPLSVILAPALPCSPWAAQTGSPHWP